MKRISTHAALRAGSFTLTMALLGSLAACGNVYELAQEPQQEQQSQAQPQDVQSGVGLDPTDLSRADDRRTETPPQEEPPAEVQACSDVRFPEPNASDGCHRVLLTRNAQGAPFNASSEDAKISRDGRAAVFTVLPTEEYGVNGLDADTNLSRDVYLVDLDSSAMELISVDPDGKVTDGDSFEPSVSERGLFVAFTSYARKLTEHALEGQSAIHVRDREANRTTLASVNDDGQPANGDSYSPLISADGRYVVFLSAATNLVPGDRNGKVDLFLRDLLDKRTERISLADDGSEPREDAQPAAGISDNAQYVLFHHPSRLSSKDRDRDELPAAKRMDVYLRDRHEGRNIMISRPLEETLPIPLDETTLRGAVAVALSPAGDMVLFRTSNVSSILEIPTAHIGHGTLMATRREGDIEHRLMYIGLGRATSMSADGHALTFTSREAGLVQHQYSTEEDGLIENGYAYDVDTAETTLATAAEDGTPGVIHDYKRDEDAARDWVGIDISGDG
ncbi:MAG: hypothetical protein ABI333_26550, partial [bacterium]